MVGDVEISEVPGYLREGVSILFPKGSVPAEVEAALASWSDQSRDVAVRSKHSAMVLDIGPVTLFGVHASSAARVRATVNGTEFQYPSMRGIEWLEVGPQMSHQQFRLPDAPSFEVRFGMELDSGEELMSLHTDFVDDLPYSGSYVLHEVESGKRSLGVSAEVSYADSSCSLDASCLTSI